MIYITDLFNIGQRCVLASSQAHPGRPAGLGHQHDGTTQPQVVSGTPGAEVTKGGSNTLIEHSILSCSGGTRTTTDLQKHPHHQQTTSTSSAGAISVSAEPALGRDSHEHQQRCIRISPLLWPLEQPEPPLLILALRAVPATPILRAPLAGDKG